VTEGATSEPTPPSQYQGVRRTGAPYSEWKVGDRDARNEDIKNVVGQRPNFIVYFVKGGWLNWFYDSENVPGAHMLEASAQILLNKGKSWIRSKKDFGEFKNIVASAMVHGLSSLEEGKTYDGCFEDAESYLRVRSKATYQILFVLSSVLTATIVGGAMFAAAELDLSSLNGTQRNLLLGGAAGAYGALLSILIRANKLEPETFSYAARLYVVLESVIRIGLGISFGFLLVLLQKAQILLSVADHNVYFMVIGAIVAGFNERLVPALLSEMEGLYGIDKSGRRIDTADPDKLPK
jgi:hypothetical protein